MWRRLGLSLLLVGGWAAPLTPAYAAEPEPRYSGPWNLAELQAAPALQWGNPAAGARKVYYAGATFHGFTTRVFGYVALPEGTGPFPAIVLAHGHGGVASSDWAAYWARRGYVALAMDLNGRGPDGLHLPDGGPMENGSMWRDFTEAEADQMWPYHAVAAVCRGVSVVTSLPEVDPQRVAVHGLSMGGCVTCIVAALDDRVACAAPVFGAGYIHENSWFLPNLNALSDATRSLWIRLFDASNYLGLIRCPILFANGVIDDYFPPDSYLHSFAQVSAEKHLSMPVDREHGPIWTITGGNVDVERFIDHRLRGGLPLPSLEALPPQGAFVSARFESPLPLRTAGIWYTTDTGPWPERRWWAVQARIDRGRILNTLPPQRPLAYFQEVRDVEWATATTPVVVVNAPADPPGNFVPAHSTFESSAPPRHGVCEVTGLRPGALYGWIRVNSEFLQLPDGTTRTRSCTFRSPGNHAVLAGPTGAVVEDVISQERPRSTRPVRRGKPSEE